MAAIGLVALHDFTFRGVTHHEGEVLHVEPVDAASLTYQRKARFETPEEQKARELAHAQDAQQRRRTYRRRDMVAEQTTTLTNDERSTD